jgi:hypothetical protein
MQIEQLAIYNRTGEKRSITFKLGQLNIITGSSHTGKSALSHIAEYCMGGESCTVPHGRIRSSVEWYALALNIKGKRICVGRRNPPNGQQSTSECVIIPGGDGTCPDDLPLRTRTNVSEVENVLSALLPISPSLSQPREGETRLPLEANIRHALIYCIQLQTEIATNRILFHRQDEEFLPKAIKDTLPYFLGAVREDDLAKQQELSRLRRSLRRLQSELDEAKAAAGTGSRNAQALLREAMNHGLVASDFRPDNEEELRLAMQEVSRWQPSNHVFSGGDQITQLQDELTGLRQSRQEKQDAIRLAKSISQDSNDYSAEASIQQSRLESVRIFGGPTGERHVCPLCDQDIEETVLGPKVVLNALAQISSDLENAATHKPRLAEYLDKTQTELASIQQELESKELALQRLIAQEADITRLRSLNASRAKVVGRVSYWLESVEQVRSDGNLQEAINRLQSEIRRLEDELSIDSIEERLAAILNRINRQMALWADEIGLEFSGNPVRLDVRRLTVTVDALEGSISLQGMGSGENWMFYHVFVYLALQQYFVTNSRPVPRFLFLDQPTQAYYPSDVQPRDRSVDELQDDDRQKVAQLFDLIRRVVAELAPSFQVILTDHANLPDADFQAEIVEEWRGLGNALVPVDW